MKDKMIYVESVGSRPYWRRRGTSDHQKHNAIHRDGVTCQHDCKRYPCFSGQQTMQRNFAITCKNFTPK